MGDYNSIFVGLSIIIAICFMVMFYTDAHAEGKHKKKIHLPPNCMYINGQLRCWVIDPLPTEEEL
jgi:hypothetical protein